MYYKWRNAKIMIEILKTAPVLTVPAHAKDSVVNVLLIIGQMERYQDVSSHLRSRRHMTDLTRTSHDPLSLNLIPDLVYILEIDIREEVRG